MLIRTLISRMNSLDERLGDVAYMKEQFPGHVPLIVRHNDVIWRQIVPGDIQFAMLYFQIRKKCAIGPTTGLAIMVEAPGGAGIQVPGGRGVEEVWREYRQEDQFLYLDILEQNVFG